MKVKIEKEEKKHLGHTIVTTKNKCKKKVLYKESKKAWAKD